MDFIEPFKYPLRNIKRLVIGGLMIFPGVFLLLIPLIMICGYCIRVAECTIKGQNKPPEFSNWKNLFIKGLGCILISVVYVIIMVVILLPAIISFLMSHGNITFLVLAIIFLLIALIPLFILLIIYTIALVKYGDSGNVGAGFKFGEIWGNFRKNLGNYVIGYILYLVLEVLLYFMLIPIFIGIGGAIERGLGTGLGTIVGIIISLPILGIICFYLCLFWMRMFAQIYNESKERLENENKSTLPTYSTY